MGLKQLYKVSIIKEVIIENTLNQITLLEPTWAFLDWC